MSETKFISVHRHPRPRVRMLTRLAVALGLSGAVIACLLQLFFALTLAPLFWGTLVFTILLSIPLLMLSVLHPEVNVTADGLRLSPLLWHAQSVRWEHLSTLTDHPLIYEDPVMNRRLHGKNRRLREGKVIVLTRNAPVLWQYRVLGLVSGASWTPAFGISTTTHTDYDQLVALLTTRLKLVVT